MYVALGVLTFKEMVEELELIKENGSNEEAEKRESQDSNQDGSVSGTHARLVSGQSVFFFKS